MKTNARNTWQLQTAKAQFSEVVRRALTEGPQRITRRGKDEVVVLPASQFEQMKSELKPKKSVYEALRSFPLAKYGVKLKRSRVFPQDYPRDIDL